MLKRIVLIAAAFVSSALSATLHVPGEYATIQAAVDAAIEGDTVAVAPGEYVVTEPLTYRGKNVKVRAATGPEATTLRMAVEPTDPNRASVVVFENGETYAATLEGLTLAGGQGTRWGADWSQYGGGGILCRNNSSPTLINCKVRRNGGAGNLGGGVCCHESSPTLIGCTISENTGTELGPYETYLFGGGMYCYAASPTLTNCAILSNGTGWGYGGGVWCDESSPTFVRCTISGNVGAGFGGGLLCQNSSPTLTDCVISENCALEEGEGGGVFCGNSSPTLTNCTITGNEATSGMGGGVYCWTSSPILTNCAIAAEYGWGVWCADSSPTLINCTLSEVWCGNSSPTLTNCIVLNSLLAADEWSTPFVAYSCIPGPAPWPGHGNINADPRLRGDADWRLRIGSPCIDAGTSEGAPAADIEGTARPCALEVDMGAYEYCPVYGLALTSAELAECAPANVYVTLTNDEPIEAFFLGVAHSPAVATLTAINYVDCPVMRALNGNAGPEFFDIDLSPEPSNCAPGILTGGTIRCLTSQRGQNPAMIPAGVDQLVARLTYEAVPGNAAGTLVPLTIVGCLGEGTPREVVLAVGGYAVTPVVAGGTLTVAVPACRFRRGDVNSDGWIEISDVASLLMYIFRNREGPLRCEDAGDANDDGVLDVGDVVRILTRIFAHGPAFAPPYPGCGTDPTRDALRCAISACK